MGCGALARADGARGGIRLAGEPGLEALHVRFVGPVRNHGGIRGPCTTAALTKRVRESTKSHPRVADDTSERYFQISVRISDAFS